MRFLKIFTISLFSQAAVLVIGFVNSILITRNLGVEGRGQYALAMSIVTVLALILGDGLYRSNTYLVSLDRSRLSSLFTNGSIAIAGFGGLLLLLTQVLGESALNSILPGLDRQLILLEVLSVIPLIFNRNLQGLMLGLQRYFIFNGFLVFPLLIYLLLNIGFRLIGSYTPELLLRNYGLSMALVAVVFLVWLLRNESIRMSPSRTLAEESITKGFKANISHLCLFMLFRVDIFLINYFLGAREAGFYSIAVLLSELLQKLANTSGTVLFPKVTGDKTGQGEKLSVRVLFFILAAGILFSVVILLFGETLIVALFKKDFAPSAGPLYWLLPGTVIMSGGKIILFTLWGRGFPRITIWMPLVAFVLNLILNWMLIPRMGIGGAAISTSLSYIVFGVGMGIYYIKNPVKVRDSREPVIEVIE